MVPNISVNRFQTIVNRFPKVAICCIFKRSGGTSRNCRINFFIPKQILNRENSVESIWVEIVNSTGFKA